jgi:hypothetical protein
MSLREQMAIDACAILSTEELGERAIWTRTGSTAGIPRTVRLIEQPDRQTVRRAHIWTPIDTTTVSVGDLFSVKRGQVTTVWRVMYTDPAETAIQRSYCHLQLSEFITLRRRKFIVTQSGSRKATPPVEIANVRCKWFQSSAEQESTSEGARRKMAGEFYLFLQEVPENLASVDTVIRDTGEAYRIDRLEQDLSRVDLPYLILRRSDA